MDELIRRTFDWIDYIVFGTMLLLSALTGLYFARKGQKTVSSYLFGDKQMAIFPITLSLIATATSGTSLLGYPTEIYLYGTPFLFGTIFCLVPTLIVMYLIIPVIYNLQLESLFEYMELRFNRSIRLMISFIYILQWILHIPVIVYGPTLALNQVTGLNMQIVPPVVCVVCILYTTMGGLKAVVWADTLQGIVMFFSVIAILVLGLHKVGGLSEMLKSANLGDRLELLSMDLDPTKRVTIWSLLLGFTFLTVSQFGTNPASFQRYLAMSTQKKAQRCVFYLYIGIAFTILLTGSLGLIMYAAYKDCDPIVSKVIKRPDQLLPLFVMDLTEHVKGVPGLFLAGIVSAALSTMSTGLNSISGTMYKDFIEPIFNTKPSEYKASLIMKITVVVIGIICTLLVFFVHQLGSIFEVTLMILGSTYGITSGIFILGILAPFVNAKGVLGGSIISLLFMSWLSIGTFLAKTNGLLKSQHKVLSVEMCSNATTTISKIAKATSVTKTAFPLFRISVFYYSLLGGGTVIIIAIVISLLTGRNKNTKLDAALFSTVVRGFLEDKSINDYENVAVLENIK